MEEKKRGLARYTDPVESARILSEVCSELGVKEVAVVRNLGYSFSPFSLYPLAPRNTGFMDRIAAFAVDMDGTSTTTEPLALHALEHMVRRATNRMDRKEWTGLHEEKDYPFIIGNSNFFHTEFLLKRYGKEIREDALKEAFFEALLWTLANVPDKKRRDQVCSNALHCGLGPLLEDSSFRTLAAKGELEDGECMRLARDFLKRFGSFFQIQHFNEKVSAALDIYYHRYHSILKGIEKGDGERLSRELLGEEGKRLIAPMPGYGIFIALIKGWLGREAGRLFPGLAGTIPAAEKKSGDGRKRLAGLGLHFQSLPARFALVTASIGFEAQAVMKEVLRVVQEEVEDWNLTAEDRNRIQERFADPRSVFDGFSTASDSHEARLKPHPDLYTMALVQMSIPPEEYAFCVGIEDTEPGIVALRAAGFGKAVALVNRDTSGQDFSMASHVLHGGLPALILEENLFLRPGRKGGSSGHG